MANSQVFLADLKAGRCSNVAEVQREARNVRKGGELTSVDMLFVDENERFACVLPAFSFYQRNAVNKVRFQVIEDVHPNGGIKKFKSSVYSNFVFSFRLRSKLVPQSNRSQVMSLIQQVGQKTHSCCMCDRALSPVSLSTPTKSSSRLLHLHI
ncbi:BnaA04g27650D [Brassica napus]|uniref:BnaA04g27650D protein n=1 Tax=Brassica napus TaxID=3708 RepID=A0A078GK93_BRANA|nr:BnaC03g69960D [Brassica napus]CDY66075.1 BnaA04g27650D [Brassica napus]